MTTTLRQGGRRQIAASAVEIGALLSDWEQVQIALQDTCPAAPRSAALGYAGSVIAALARDSVPQTQGRDGFVYPEKVWLAAERAVDLLITATSGDCALALPELRELAESVQARPQPPVPWEAGAITLPAGAAVLVGLHRWGGR